MSKASQDFLIDECNNLLKIINGQFEKISNQFYNKEIDLCILDYIKQEGVLLQTSNNINRVLNEVEKSTNTLKEDIKRNKIDEILKFDI